MANRVLLGERSGQQGLWVSRPGFNVVNTEEGNLLFSMSGILYQVGQAGIFNIPDGASSLNIPITIAGNFSPQVLIFGFLSSGGIYYPDIFDYNVTSSNLTIFVASDGFYRSGSYIIFYEGII